MCLCTRIAIWVHFYLANCTYNVPAKSWVAFIGCYVHPLLVNCTFVEPEESRVQAMYCTMQLGSLLTKTTTCISMREHCLHVCLRIKLHIVSIKVLTVLIPCSPPYIGKTPCRLEMTRNMPMAPKAPTLTPSQAGAGLLFNGGQFSKIFQIWDDFYDNKDNE
jgi:hypothetical protein